MLLNSFCDLGFTQLVTEGIILLSCRYVLFILSFKVKH